MYDFLRFNHRRPAIARKSAIWLFAAASVTASNASAQQLVSDTDKDDRPALAEKKDEIIVTARRTDENVQTIPVAVTVLTTERIEALAINTPLDLNKVAGVGGAPIGSLTSVNFTIRGQGTAFGGQPGVIPYFAEVPGFPLSYYDLENIQVIKGPQGTLFGQTTTGGVILFEPKRPTDRFEGHLAVEVGNHDYRQFEGALNIPVIADHLFVRAAFRIRDRDGWAKGIRSRGKSPVDLNDLDNASFRASLLWKPNDNFENYTLFTIDRLRSNGTASPLYYIDPRFMNPAARNLVPARIPSIAATFEFWTGYAPPADQSFSQLLTAAYRQQLAAGPRTMYTDYDQSNETINRGLINQTSWQIADNLRVKNIFGLRWQTARGAIYDQDATNLPLLDFACRYVPGTATASAPGTCAKTGGWPDRTVTNELQLQGQSFGDKLQWQVGGFYLEGGTRKFRESTRPFIVFGTASGDPASAAFCASVSVSRPCTAMARTRTKSYALFGQATYAVLPNLRITAGYRQTWDRTRTDTTGKASFNVPFRGFPITVPTYGGDRAVGSSIVSTIVDLPANGSYNVSLDWQVTDNLLLYAAHRSGYKTGGINVVADPGAPERIYGPERARDFELGVKSEWRLGGMRGRINASYFRTWYSNIQGGDIIPGTAQTVTRNLADAKIDGVEIEGSLFPVDWLRLAANLAYTDARYSDWKENSNCGAQYWRPQCAGLGTTTPVMIDHAGGSITIAGQTIAFEPDRFANTSKWQWAFQPALLLEPLTGQDIELSANIYHRSPYVDSVAVANNSKLAGVPPLAAATVFGYVTADPYVAPGYTIADLRVAWRHVEGSRFSLAAAVTNIADKNYRVSSGSAFEIIGDVYTLTGEPRMWWLQLAVDF